MWLKGKWASGSLKPSNRTRICSQRQTLKSKSVYLRCTSRTKSATLWKKTVEKGFINYSLYMAKIKKCNWRLSIVIMMHSSHLIVALRQNAWPKALISKRPDAVQKEAKMTYRNSKISSTTWSNANSSWQKTRKMGIKKMKKKWKWQAKKFPKLNHNLPLLLSQSLR